MPRQSKNQRFDLSKIGTIDRDIVYGSAGDVPLTMDIYFPATFQCAPWPVVVLVHGGGWTGGDKALTDGLRDTPEYLRRGYVVVSLDYRLAPQYQFPAQIQDCKCAIRHLRAHAESYHLDPMRIGAWGGSAGGHLVALLALADQDLWAEPNPEFADQSSMVQAVVSLYAPNDLTQTFPAATALVDRQVFAAESKSDRRLSDASPVTHVCAGAPPFLLLHGESDDLVPLCQSEMLGERLAGAGVPVQLIVVKNAGHVFVPVDGKSIAPTREQITQIIADFFDRVLK